MRSFRTQLPSATDRPTGTPGQHLIVFVKAPRPGSVKTRLAHTIGADEACAAYCQLVDALLEQIAGLSRVELRYTPDDACQEIERWIRNGWTSSPQGSGDLGGRIARAFQEAFAAGNSRVLVIGSDCPDAGLSDLNEAWNKLDSHDVVLGPAADGGYWLVGLQAPQLNLFNDMAWSTADVLSETVRRCEIAGLKVAMLRILTDIDTEEDWRAWINERRVGRLNRTLPPRQDRVPNKD